MRPATRAPKQCQIRLIKALRLESDFQVGICFQLSEL